MSESSDYAKLLVRSLIATAQVVALAKPDSLVENHQEHSLTYLADIAVGLITRGLSNTMYTIPKGTAPAQCPRGCGVEVYWIEAPRSGGIGTARLPIDTTPKGCSEPDSLSVGHGVNHSAICASDRE
jgi:hypothetical protein